MVLLYSTTGSIQTSKAAATTGWNRIQHKGLQLIKSEPFTIELCLPINAKLVQMDYCRVVGSGYMTVTVSRRKDLHMQ